MIQVRSLLPVVDLMRERERERESDKRTWWLEGEVSDSPGMTVIGPTRGLGR